MGCGAVCCQSPNAVKIWCVNGYQGPGFRGPCQIGADGVDDKSPAGGVSATVGWLVGWAEKGSAQTVFALNLEIHEPRHIASRMKLTQQLLSDVGAT